MRGHTAPGRRECRAFGSPARLTPPESRHRKVTSHAGSLGYVRVSTDEQSDSGAGLSRKGPEAAGHPGRVAGLRAGRRGAKGGALRRLMPMGVVALVAAAAVLLLGASAANPAASSQALQGRQGVSPDRRRQGAAGNRAEIRATPGHAHLAHGEAASSPHECASPRSGCRRTLAGLPPLATADAKESRTVRAGRRCSRWLDAAGPPRRLPIPAMPDRR